MYNVYGNKNWKFVCFSRKVKKKKEKVNTERTTGVCAILFLSRLPVSVSKRLARRNVRINKFEIVRHFFFFNLSIFLPIYRLREENYT